MYISESANHKIQLQESAKKNIIVYIVGYYDKKMLPLQTNQSKGLQKFNVYGYILVWKILNPFNPKLIIQIPPTIQEEND